MNEIILNDKSDLSFPVLPKTFLPAISQLINYLGIPRELLASDEEIEFAWRDLPRELRNLPPDTEGELIARMCVAVSTGLFDSAVNYIWNASILNLRKKIRIFGFPVVAQTLQHDFEERNLIDLQDSQLLELCHKLNILNDDGFFFLDQCRDIRNNFSAAHPTLGKINDREFINFLNRCIKYALADSSSHRGVQISDFISAVKGTRFSQGQCQVWTDRLLSTHEAQRQLLIGTAHGIYCDPASPEPARLNSLDLCNSLKQNFSSNVNSQLITCHSEYLAKGDENRYKASLQFFEKLGSLYLLSEAERHTIVAKAIDRLMIIHQGLDNFYNEPPFAERLLEISHISEIPETIQKQYVQTVICCFIGNGYGVCWKAESLYMKMIQEFSPKEIILSLQLVQESNIVNKRMSRNSLCRSRFIQALKLIDSDSIPVSVRADYDNFLT